MAVVGSIGWLLLRLAGMPRRWAVVVLLPLIFGYSWLTGHSPPAERSEISITWLGEVCCPPPELETVMAKMIAAPAPAPTGPFEPVDLTTAFNDRVTEIFRPMKYVSPRSPYVSLALPAQGIGAWAGHVNATAEIDDAGLRAVAEKNGGRFVLPNGVPFATARRIGAGGGAGRAGGFSHAG